MRKKTKLESFLWKNRNKDLCIVFDLGSTAARALIGPPVKTNDLNLWDPFKWFHIGLRKFELHGDLESNGEINLENEAFGKTIEFINEIKERLEKRTRNNNFTLVGTEVFRAAINQKKAINRIKLETGLEVIILDKESEALLSLLAVIHTYKYPSDGINISEIKENDTILLFDQGGGSTEISYYKLKDKEFGNQLSLSQIGTISLRNKFFSNNSSATAGKSTTKISDQFKLIYELVDSRINQEFEQRVDLKDISRQANGLHGFVTGASIKNTLEKLKYQKGKQLHCQEITVEDIGEVLGTTSYDLKRSDKQVLFLFTLLNSPSIDTIHKSKIESTLLLLLGLPIYVKLLHKFNLRKARYSYFNLKHGVFFAQNLYHLDITKLQSLQVKDIMP